MPKTNALYGSGGFGREVMPILKNLYPNDRNIFVVHKEFMPEQSLSLIHISEPTRP